MLRDNLKQLREERGWTQEELARRLHVVRQTISKWEKGTSVPDADLLARIAELYGVSASSLLDEQPIADAELEYVATQTALLNERLDHQEERRREIVRYLCIAAGVLVAIVFVLLMIRGAPVQSSDPFLQITYEIDGLQESVGIWLDENDLTQAFGCFGVADIAEAAESQVAFDEYGHVSASRLQKAVETAVREAGGTVVSIERHNFPENTP